jgi:hypothetical protein
MNFNKIKQMWSDLTTPPTPAERAIKELQGAKRSYLENKTLAEYYQSLCSFEMQRVARLEKYLDPEPPKPD